MTSTSLRWYAGLSECAIEQACRVLVVRGNRKRLSAQHQGRDLASCSDARPADTEQWKASPRTLCFQRLRTAILLIGGAKPGDDRWYEKFVPIADRLYEQHLDEIQREGKL